MRWLLSAAVVVLALACEEPSTDPGHPVKSWELGPDAWPATCDAAARDAIGLLSPDEREAVRTTPRDERCRPAHREGCTARGGLRAQRPGARASRDRPVAGPARASCPPWSGVPADSARRYAAGRDNPGIDGPTYREQCPGRPPATTHTAPPPLRRPPSTGGPGAPVAHALQLHEAGRNNRSCRGSRHAPLSTVHCEPAKLVPLTHFRGLPWRASIRSAVELALAELKFRFALFEQHRLRSAL